MKRIIALILLSAFATFAQGGRLTQDPWVSNRQGNPAAGATVAVCQPLATTAATLSSTIATFTMSSNPVAAGFVNGMQLQVSGFTGADTYFNVGSIVDGELTNGIFIILVTSTQIIAGPIGHINGTASSNGALLQVGNSITPCAGLSSLYSDSGLSISTANPLTADGLGNYGAFVTPGQYYTQIYGSGITTSIRPMSIACVPSGSGCSSSGGSPGGSDTQVQFNFAGVFGGAAGITYTAATHDTTIQNASGAQISTNNGGFVSLKSADGTGFYALQGGQATVQVEGNSVFSASSTDTYIGISSNTNQAHFSSSGVSFGTSVSVTGNLTTNLTGGGTQCVQTSNAGVLSGTGLACGIGTVNSGTSTHLPCYLSTGTALSDCGADLVFNGTHTFSSSASLIWNLSTAAHTFPIIVVSTSGGLPATCTVGEMGYVTGATAGQNLYFCNSTNTWTQQLNSGSAGMSTNGSNAASTAVGASWIPGSANSYALGSAALPWTNVFIGLAANQALSFSGLSSLTANRTAFVPNANSSLMAACTSNSNTFVDYWSITTGLCHQSFISPNATTPNGYVLDTGTATAYVLPIPVPLTSLAAGVTVYMLPSHANTGTTPTLNVSSLGAATITKFGQVAVSVNDLVTTSVAVLVYDGTYWELQNPNTLVSTVTASSTTTLTNKTFNAESTGNVLSEPIKAFFAAAGCSGGSTAGPAIDTGASNVPNPQCQGSTVPKGVLQFARGNAAYINWHLPLDWNSSASTDIELGFTTTDTTSGHITSWNIQTGCAKTDGTVTDDPSLNALQALSVTTGASQTSGGVLTGTKTGLTMTGCAADYIFEIAITRNNSGTDTNTDTAVGLKFAEITTGVTKNAANR